MRVVVTPGNTPGVKPRLRKSSALEQASAPPAKVLYGRTLAPGGQAVVRVKLSRPQRVRLRHGRIVKIPLKVATYTRSDAKFALIGRNTGKLVVIPRRRRR